MEPIIPVDERKLYSINEVAERWGVDESWVRRIFQDTDGVLQLSRGLSRRGKRQYITLRIPGSFLAAYEREHSRSR